MDIRVGLQISILGRQMCLMQVRTCAYLCLVFLEGKNAAVLVVLMPTRDWTVL